MCCAAIVTAGAVTVLLLILRTSMEDTVAKKYSPLCAPPACLNTCFHALLAQPLIVHLSLCSYNIPPLAHDIPTVSKRHERRSRASNLSDARKGFESHLCRAKHLWSLHLNLVKSPITMWVVALLRNGFRCTDCTDGSAGTRTTGWTGRMGMQRKRRAAGWT